MKQVELIVRRQGEATRRFRLRVGDLSIGRAEDNGLVLPDVEVSRRHAKITVTADGVTVEDLGSGNGTYLNGSAIESEVVEDGTKVVIAPYTLEFSMPQHVPEQHTDPGSDPSLLADSALESVDFVGARLVTLQGQGLDESYDLGAKGATLGRSEQREITVPDPAASRNHSELLNASGSWWVRDNGSVNGTFVNGRRIRETPLSTGDRIRIGATEFRFELLEGDDQATSTLPFVASMFSDDTAGSDGTVPLPPTAPRSLAAGTPSPLPPPAHPPVATELEFAIDAESAVGGKRLKRGGGAGGPQSGTWMSRNIRKLTVGLFACAMLLVFVRKLGEDDSREGTASGLNRTAASVVATSPLPALDPADRPSGLSSNIDDLLAQGKARFAERQYLDAARLFDEVQRIAPGESTSRKLGYYSCEYLVLDELRKDVVRRSSSAAEQDSVLASALSLSDSALTGRGEERVRPRVALEKVREALNFFPDNDELKGLERDLQRRIRSLAAGATKRKAAAFSEEIGTLFSAAERKEASGDFIAAIKEFERVLSADSDRNTEFTLRAQDRIRALKAQLDRQVRDAYTAGLSALKSGNFLDARRQFRRVIQANPYHRAAPGKLQMTQAKLDGLALESFDQAKIYEKLNKLDLAIKNYQKTIDYSKSKSVPLAAKARRKINQLSGLQ